MWCSWSIACRRCSNYIFIPHLIIGFNTLRNDSCKLRRETFFLGFCASYIIYFTVFTTEHYSQSATISLGKCRLPFWLDHHISYRCPTVFIMTLTRVVGTLEFTVMYFWIYTRLWSLFECSEALVILYLSRHMQIKSLLQTKQQYKIICCTSSWYHCLEEITQCYTHTHTHIIYIISLVYMARWRQNRRDRF